METALNGVWDARIVPGQRVAIVGAGTVGCLVARLAAQIPVCDVELVDTNRARAAVARALGVGFAEPGAAAGEADVVVHASGTGAGLAAGLALAGPEEARWSISAGMAISPWRCRLAARSTLAA